MTARNERSGNSHSVRGAEGDARIGGKLGSERRVQGTPGESAHHGRMRFPPGLLDEIRARLPVSHVVARKVALKRAGREYKGLSPFKVEKTPSFFVNDQKGSWFDFSSGQNGDIFKFLMLTEGVSFPEAVERLAEEAGVPMPKIEQRSAVEVDERTRLLALLEASAVFFQDELRGARGADARRYLERRGLDRRTIEHFRIGYGPAHRSALKAHLEELKFTPEEMIRAGMLATREDSSVPYDRFRHRIMFPITDLKGRIIAFGGRALDPDAPAKYLNSPETPTFHKGSVLFHAAGARTAAHDRGQILVVEGYMDVAALWQAGFEHAVAPLGTALTEDQLKLLWRLAPEPILCFDGDSAGKRAAFRAVDTALPHLKPGMSVTFAFLPNGLDPDELVRQSGPEAMKRVLDEAQPLAQVLWQREWGTGLWNTPERRAMLDQRLSALVANIADIGVRQHYSREMRSRLFAAWGHGGRNAGGDNRPYMQRRVENPRDNSHFRSAGRGSGRASRAGEVSRPAPSQSLKQSRLVGGAAAPAYREALLLRALLNHPWLVDEHAEEIAGVVFGSPALARLRDIVLELKGNDISLDSRLLRTQLETLDVHRVVDLVERAITHRSDKFAEAEADRAEVEVGWRHTLALHERQVGLQRALEAAERAFQDEGSEEALARICEIQNLIASSVPVEAPVDG